MFPVLERDLIGDLETLGPVVRVGGRAFGPVTRAQENEAGVLGWELDGGAFVEPSRVSLTR